MRDIYKRTVLYLWFRWYWLWRPLCWIRGHELYALDTTGGFRYSAFCPRCLKFWEYPGKDNQ